MDEKLILKQCPLFSALDEKSLEQLEKVSKLVESPQGELIFSQDDPCHGFYIVGTGNVKVFRLSPSGREHILHVIHPGQSFGEAAIFSGTSFPACAQSLEKSILVYFEKESFLSLLEKDFTLSKGMMKGLSIWLRNMVSLMDSIALSDVETRLARFLLQLAASHPMENRSGGKITLPIQKQVLASHIATTPPTLSRALGKLEAENLIKVSDLKIEFLDFPGLKQRAFNPMG